MASIDEFAMETGPEKHSTIGIISLVITVAAGVIELGLFVAAGLLTSSVDGLTEESPVAAAIGLGIICMPAFMLIGTVLGVVGLFQKDRKKLFPILSVAISGIAICIFVLLLILGVALVASVGGI